MTDLFHVEFERPFHGWMVSRFRAGSALLEIRASQIPYDSIGDLVGALFLVMKGGPEARVLWNEEPTEYEFQFAVESDTVRLTVLSYPDSRRKKNAGKEVFRLEGSRLAVCMSFWHALCRLESSTPVSEYKAAWGHDFSEAAMDRLTEILEQAKSSRN